MKTIDGSRQRWDRLLEACSKVWGGEDEMVVLARYVTTGLPISFVYIGRTSVYRVHFVRLFRHFRHLADDVLDGCVVMESVDTRRHHPFNHAIYAPTHTKSCSIHFFVLGVEEACTACLGQIEVWAHRIDNIHISCERSSTAP